MLVLSCLCVIVVSCLVYIVVVVLCVLLSFYVYLVYCVCIAVFTSDVGLLATSQYSEGPATGHLDTGFSWFRCVYKQMLRWFPRFQVATTCFSCSPPDLNLLMWSKKPTRCHLVLYLFLLYKLFNMFRATLCPSSGADDLVVFFHVWCSALAV